MFLAIGSLFTPLGLLNAGIQALLSRWTPIDALLNLVHGTVLESAITLGFRALRFGIVYWLVSIAVIAALSEMDEGRAVDARRAYAVAFGKLRPLLGARIRAALILILLAVTLVGIPSPSS